MSRDMRLIDAIAFIKKLKATLLWCDEQGFDPEFTKGCKAAIRDVISDLLHESVTPTIDAMPIVRCKDCLDRDMSLAPCLALDDKDFCSLGRSKETKINKRAIDLCKCCDIPDNPRFFDTFTCADCACHDCNYIHECKGQCDDEHKTVC